ncbi:MAG: hypothetical protein LBS53_09230 [Synergistaceae bacterium]|jgi:hypothetical protein|nr:hypothetical protein [Synergistaceae bacterium]
MPLNIAINGTTWKVELYENKAVRNLMKSLPQTINMSSWGDEFYGRLQYPVAYGDDQQRVVFEIGEVALWPAGNSLCIFFGPTPASQGNEPRMASPGVPLGKISGDVREFLSRLPASIKAALSA